MLFAGDALITDGEQPALPAASLSEDPARARSTLAALRDLPFQHLLPGHGAPLLGNAYARVTPLLDKLLR